MILIRFILHIFGTVLSIYASVLLWRWFMIPLGAPHLHWAHLTGLRLLVQWAAYSPNWSDLLSHDDDEAKLSKAILSILLPVFIMASGYIFASVMN